MKQSWIAMTMTVVLAVATATAGLVPGDAEAKRLGGGGSQGMQRSMPANNPGNRTPVTPAQAPANAAAPLGGAAAAAATPKRNWMGPIAGLAAGLGIAALMSHFGMGAAMGNFLMIALLAVAGFFLVRLLMQRFGPKTQGSSLSGPDLQMAGAAGRYADSKTVPHIAPLQRAALAPEQAAPFTGGSTSAFAPVSDGGIARTMSIPAGFDSAGFERIAKMIFIRMQTANDSGDLNDLRNFTTPEMFASVRLELQERGTAPQNTDVVKVDAEVLEVVEEAERQIVSVRFHGLIREERDAAATNFDEVWHLVKPSNDSRSWAIAGIQQR